MDANRRIRMNKMYRVYWKLLNGDEFLSQPMEINSAEIMNLLASLALNGDVDTTEIREA